MKSYFLIRLTGGHLSIHVLACVSSLSRKWFYGLVHISLWSALGQIHFHIWSGIRYEVNSERAHDVTFVAPRGACVRLITAPRFKPVKQKRFVPDPTVLLKDNQMSSCFDFEQCLSHTIFSNRRLFNTEIWLGTSLEKPYRGLPVLSSCFGGFRDKCKKPEKHTFQGGLMQDDIHHVPWLTQTKKRWAVQEKFHIAFLTLTRVCFHMSFFYFHTKVRTALAAAPGVRRKPESHLERFARLLRPSVRLN